jgi:hypothetical protein
VYLVNQCTRTVKFTRNFRGLIAVVLGPQISSKISELAKLNSQEGHIILKDSPERRIYREFWLNGMPLLANKNFTVGTIQETERRILVSPGLTCRCPSRKGVAVVEV